MFTHVKCRKSRQDGKILPLSCVILMTAVPNEMNEVDEHEEDAELPAGDADAGEHCARDGGWSVRDHA